MAYWQTLFYTIALETAVAFVYIRFSSEDAFKKMKKSFVVLTILGLNLVSHPLIWLIYFQIEKKLEKEIAIVLVETMAIVIEAELLVKVLVMKRKTSYFLGFLLNITSLLLGFLIEIFL